MSLPVTVERDCSSNVSAKRNLPRKVLMSTDAVGGVWNYAIELARGLGQNGVAAHLAVLGPEPTHDQRMEANAIASLELTTTNLPLDWTAHRECELDAAASRLQEIAAATGADLVHLNAPAHAGTLPWDLPLVVTAHSCLGTWWRAVRGGSMPDDMIWRVRRTAQGLALANAVIAPSRSFGEELASTYGAALPLRIVLNGRGSAPSLTQPKMHVLTAGRLWDAGKNMRTLDAAAGSTQYPVLAAGPLIGPNGEHETFRNLHLLGNLPAAALARWYSRCTVFLSASLYEPFGLSVLEAAKAGAALVLSDIPTFRELWGGAAVFLDPHDSRAWARTIDLLAEDHVKRVRLAGMARERAESFGAEAMCRDTLAVYAEVLRGRLDPLHYRETAYA